ncbi:MAG: ABC transporter permease [Kutzneria sp.]|nr:ABC transporter permease [Kutzneria sp.]
MATTVLASRGSREQPSGRDNVPGRSALRTTAGLLFTPILLSAVCLALFAYLGSRDLDDIERRSINAEVIGRSLVEHLRLVALSTVIVVVIAVPLGILLTRPGPRRLAPVFLALANIGQAVPSVGLLVLLAVTAGIGFSQAVVALVVYSLLPVLRNTMIGLQRVDRTLIDAGRGMGLTRTAVLFRVELPLAIPVMLAGIRVALIINVGTATLAVFTNAGGLGTLIETGIVLNRITILLTGSILAAVLALAVDWLAGLAERLLRPRGL